MKLIVYADLHHYSGNRETAIFNKTQKLTQYAMPMMDELIDKVNNQFRPDAVINLGDSIQDANNQDMDIVSLNQIAAKIKGFDCPHYMVMGNHDLKMFDDFDIHKKIFGYDSFNYSVDLGGCHLVFMTNGIVKERGTEGGGVEKTRLAVKETADWLRADLKKNEKPCVIFTHYPLIGFEGLDRRHVVENADELFEIIDANKNVIAVVSGHTHKAYSKQRNGVDYHVVGSPTASPLRNDVPDGVYYELNIENNKVRVTEHKFESREAL